MVLYCVSGVATFVAQVNHNAWLQYFKLIFLETQNVPLRTVFANPVTYMEI